MSENNLVQGIMNGKRNTPANANTEKTRLKSIRIRSFIKNLLIDKVNEEKKKGNVNNESAIVRAALDKVTKDAKEAQRNPESLLFEYHRKIFNVHNLQDTSPRYNHTTAKGFYLTNEQIEMIDQQVIFRKKRETENPTAGSIVEDAILYFYDFDYDDVFELMAEYDHLYEEMRYLNEY